MLKERTYRAVKRMILAGTCARARSWLSAISVAA
jgi:hypothetical protein